MALPLSRDVSGVAPRIRTRGRRWRVGAVVVVFGAFVASGCATDDDGEGDVGSVDESGAAPAVLERMTDEVCIDPVGDISDDIAQEEGSLSEPAGIDLVRGEVEFLGEDDAPTDLRVTFEVAGDPTEVDDPRFSLLQGEIGRLTSWELLTRRVDGAWVVEMVTYEPDRRALAVAITETLAIDVDVQTAADRSRIEFVVPVRTLPPVVSVWVFGSSAELDGEVVFDLCSNLDERVVGPDGELPGQEPDTTPTTS